jgi:hypothetical protein
MLNYYYHIRAIWGHYCIDHYDRIKSWRLLLTVNWLLCY